MKAKLDRIIALLEKGWCKGVLAKDKDGKPVRMEDPTATQFCACNVTLNPDDYWEVHTLLKAKVGCIAEWNDRSTKEEVLKVFKEIRDEVSS